LANALPELNMFVCKIIQGQHNEILFKY